ncbi:hypothetical protein NCAS_0A00670 [Naumovozyma castellii]|uniref:Essential protein Yae1 N-terminal domain-containing protein n=1 Tax=Naumovozyma castellii TaxID=27288 RepID=G0V591_NAUCA|nr:hypothetical protein NCAS_0A00670 [Naumovozyma castellii CBS 4309]CCC66627.1 hypothetical protein NCAS_0A00670 [Naumovozyma castellii CBS 4309]
MDIFDNLLNLEEQFYEEGWEEGHNENLKNNFLEGKQFGLQVGFQRFVLLGQMTGFCDVLDSLELGNQNLEKNVESIRSLIKTVGLSNKDEDVENLEKILVKLKNKFRTILISVNRLTKQDKKRIIDFDDFEDLSRIIAGEVKGFVEDEDVDEAKTAQDQAQAW